MSRNKVVPGRVIFDEEAKLEIRFNRHPKKKNNLRVAAMYEAYKEGKSLEEIGEMYGITRQAVYDVFHTRRYPLRSKQLIGARIVDGVRYTLDSGGFLRGTRQGRRVYLHKVVWESTHGPVPEGFYIRFLNNDKSDVRLENMELIAESDFKRRFIPRRNQFTSPNGSRRKAFDRIREERAAAYSGND